MTFYSGIKSEKYMTLLDMPSLAQLIYNNKYTEQLHIYQGTMRVANSILVHYT